MPELRSEDFTWEPSSVVDPVGQVFWREGRVFRAIAPPYVESIRHAVELAHKHNWFEKGLIPTWLTDDRLPDFPLVIEHQRIPCATFRYEWSAEGLRAAALCYLRVAAALAEHRMCLKDSHSWNVLFERSTPYVIDWGSVQPDGHLDWRFWYFQFRKYFLAPLYLFSIGQTALARALLREHVIGVGNELLDLTVAESIPEQPYRIFQRAAGSGVTRDTFLALADYVEGLPIQYNSTAWAGYEQPRFETLDDLSALREKDRIVGRLIADDPGATLLDLGCNYGLHSDIAAALGKRVIAADIEEACISDLFLRTRQSGRDILTLYLDFLWPMGESGATCSIPAVHQRVQSDTVLAMALIHHLSFNHNLAFEAFARNLSRFTSRRAIVEFIPADDIYVSQWEPERRPWYNLDHFITAMRRYFQTHTVIPSSPDPRLIVIFEGKKS